MLLYNNPIDATTFVLVIAVDVRVIAVVVAAADGDIAAGFIGGSDVVTILVLVVDVTSEAVVKAVLVVFAAAGIVAIAPVVAVLVAAVVVVATAVVAAAVVVVVDKWKAASKVFFNRISFSRLSRLLFLIVLFPLKRVFIGGSDNNDGNRDNTVLQLINQLPTRASMLKLKLMLLLYWEMIKPTMTKNKSGCEYLSTENG